MLVISAIIEELVFRGFLYRYVWMEHEEPGNGMIITSLSFAIVHMFNKDQLGSGEAFIQILFAFVFSILACELVSKSYKYLVITIAIHVIINLINSVYSNISIVIFEIIILTLCIIGMKINANKPCERLNNKFIL